MMEKVFISVEKSSRMVNLTKKYIGNDLENLQQELIFKFTDEFVSGSARLEYQIENNKYHIPMTKDGETYTVPIKNVITKEGKIPMQLVVVQTAKDKEIPVFKSNVFDMWCNKSINANEEAPDDYEYWLDVIEEKLAEMDEALEQVDNLDVDVYQEDDITTISITKKNGTTKSVSFASAGENSTYIHRQDTASSSWEITHNMDKFPSVSVVDSGENIVVGDVTYVDNNNLIITFSAPFTGKAYLN